VSAGSPAAGSTLWNRVTEEYSMATTRALTSRTGRSGIAFVLGVVGRGVCLGADDDPSLRVAPPPFALAVVKHAFSTTGDV